MIVVMIPQALVEYPTITDTLTYTIKSKIGAGAILKPKFVVRPEGYQGTVRQVIDCISKDDNFVGYVNGKKYYGPFHIHMGRKMTGVSHTGSGQYIYDTPAESLGSASRPVTTTTTTTTATVTSTPTATPSPTPTLTPTPPATSGGGGSAPPSPTPTLHHHHQLHHQSRWRIIWWYTKYLEGKQWQHWEGRQYIALGPGCKLESVIPL